MCLSDSDLLISESGLPAILQALLYYRSRLIAGSYGHPELALAPLGCDDDPEAANKTLCHASFLIPCGSQ